MNVYCGMGANNKHHQQFDLKFANLRHHLYFFQFDSMIKIAVFLACLCVGVWGGGIPLVIPTVGKVWPKPQMEVTQDTFVTVRPDVFR